MERIKKLKEKVDNINNDDYNHKMIYDYDDELYTLEVALENARLYLRQQDEYKNQMYQNISHDFKTPITVMKSYIEASEDGIESNEKTLKVLKEPSGCIHYKECTDRGIFMTAEERMAYFQGTKRRTDAYQTSVKTKNRDLIFLKIKFFIAVTIFVLFLSLDYTGYKIRGIGAQEIISEVTKDLEWNLPKAEGLAL